MYIIFFLLDQSIIDIDICVSVQHQIQVYIYVYICVCIINVYVTFFGFFSPTFRIQINVFYVQFSLWNTCCSLPFHFIPLWYWLLINIVSYSIYYILYCNTVHIYTIYSCACLYACKIERVCLVDSKLSECALNLCLHIFRASFNIVQFIYAFDIVVCSVPSGMYFLSHARAIRFERSVVQMRKEFNYVYRVRTMRTECISVLTVRASAASVLICKF